MQGAAGRCEICDTQKHIVHASTSAAATSAHLPALEMLGAGPEPAATAGAEQQPGSGKRARQQQKVTPGAVRSDNPPSGTKRGRESDRAAAPSGVYPQPHPAWRGGRTGWVLLGSGLNAEGKATVEALAQASRASVLSKWSPKVTHVVCGSIGTNTARRVWFHNTSCSHNVLHRAIVNSAAETTLRICTGGLSRC